MPVPGHPVRLQAVGGFGVQRADLCLPSRAGDARLAVGDQVQRIDQPRGQQRLVAQLYRGRVAAGQPDDARAADRLAVDLGQAVDRLFEQPGAGVRHLVPAFELGRVSQAEVGREVDQPHTGFKQRGRRIHRDPVRGGEEHHVAVGQPGRRGIRERDADPTAQAGEHLGHRHAGFLARGDRLQVGIRMRGQQAQQLDAGVAGAADDADAQTPGRIHLGAARCRVLGHHGKPPGVVR